MKESRAYAQALHDAKQQSNRLNELDEQIEKVFNDWNDGGEKPITHKEAKHLMLQTVLQIKKPQL